MVGPITKRRISNDAGKLTAEGETNIQKTRLHGTELGYPITAQYDMTDDLAVDMIAIRKFASKLGSTPLRTDWCHKCQTDTKTSAASR